MSDQDKPTNPLVFISVNGYQTVVITPNNPLPEEEWGELRKVIVETYINECILGEHSSPGGRCEGAPKIIEFMERHPEWDCNFIQGHSVQNWMLVE